MGGDEESAQKHQATAGTNWLLLILALFLGGTVHVAYLEYLERSSLLSVVKEDDAAKTSGSNNNLYGLGSSSSSTNVDDLDVSTSPRASRSKYPSSNSHATSLYLGANGKPLGWPGQHDPEAPGWENKNMPPLPADWPFAEEANLFRELVEAKSNIDWTAVVANQLVQWKDTGYTQKNVDEYCVKKVVVASFVKNEFRVQSFGHDAKNGHRLRCGFWLMKSAAIRAAARGNPIPDFEVAVLSGDSAFSLSTPSKRWDDAGPLLSNIKCDDASVSFPLTLHDMFGGGDGEMGLALYAKKYKQALEWSGSKEWESLENIAFFCAGGGLRSAEIVHTSLTLARVTANI